MLLYAGIDAMAWLDRPESSMDVTARDFINWTDKYLLSGDGLTGEDLYEARCGILHSLTGESKRHRELRARKLFYHREFDGKRIGIVQLMMNEKFDPPSVDLDALVATFKSAISNFREDYEKDNARRSLIYRRVRQSYLSEVIYE